MIPNVVPSGSRYRSAGADDCSLDRQHGAVVRRQARDHFASRDDRRRGPARRTTDVHVFDEAQLGADGLGILEQRHQLVVVDAADDDGVELERMRTRSLPRRRCRRTPGADRRCASARGTRSRSSVSRLTVIRWRPAARSADACARQQHAVGRHREVVDGGLGGE